MSVFSFYVHVHQQRLHHCLCHPSALHPARRRFTLKSQGPLSTIVTIVPSSLPETTTQLSGLLSAAVRSLTSILLVTERQLPAYSERGGHIRYHCAFDSNKRPNTQQQQDYYTQHYLSQTHNCSSIVISNRTTTLNDPSTAIGSRATGTADS